MALTEKQKNCLYCHDGWFDGSSGWQHCKVFFCIDNEGVMETMVDGHYGYKKGLKVCPFCQRELGVETDENS